MKKGFTLVEVLAVIVLTSFIMFIAIPAIINTVNKNGYTIGDYKYIEHIFCVLN